MKKLLVLFLFLFTFSACKKEKAMLVIKDCTGTYLRHHSKDYEVCNYQDLASFEEGTEVEAIYTRIEECKSDRTVCSMLHSSEGLIHVDEIRYR